MNKTLAITTIAFVAGIMVFAAIAPAMAAVTWKPCHTEKELDPCVTGQPDSCLIAGRGNDPGFVWYNDLNNDNVQNGKELSSCFRASDNPNAPRGG